MKKYLSIAIIIVLIIIVVGVTIYFVTKDKGEDVASLKKINVNEVTRSVFYAPQYVAIAKGYMAEEGLEIELTTGQGADKVMTAVLAGQSDIGFAGPEASIYVYNEGKEDYCQVFAQLKQNGIDPQKDLILDDSIKFDLMAGAFSGGTADYVTLFEPTATMTANAGKGYVVASVGEASGEIPYTAYFAKKSYIESNSDTIQKFTNAIYKGQKFVEEHTMKEVAEVIKDFFPDTDVDLLATVLQSYKDIDAWKTQPTMKEESFELLQKVMQEAGELSQKAPFNKIVNNSYAEKVK